MSNLLMTGPMTGSMTGSMTGPMTGPKEPADDDGATVLIFDVGKPRVLNLQ